MKCSIESKKEVSRKIVQYIKDELYSLENKGIITWSFSPIQRQDYFRDWAVKAMQILCESCEEKQDEVFVGQFDGSAKPNPGIMKIGGHIKNLKDMDTALYSFSIGLGIGTNNQAEYLALIELLEIGIKKGIKRINIYGDSNLAVMQVNGKWKANKAMAPFRDQVLQLLKKFDHWTLSHVPRELNSEADSLTR